MAAETGSGFGPVLFFGLIGYTAVSAAFLPKSSNPALRMQFDLLPQAASVAPDKADTSGLPLPQLMAAARMPAPAQPKPVTADTARLQAQPPARVEIYVPDLPAASAPEGETGLAGLTLPLAEPGYSEADQPHALPGQAEPDGKPRQRPVLLGGQAALTGGFGALVQIGPLPILPATETAILRPDPLARPVRAALSEAPIPPTPRWLTVTGDFVHLRERASARSGFAARLNSGTRVQELERRRNWVRIYLPGSNPVVTGWMFHRYLSPVAER